MGRIRTFTLLTYTPKLVYLLVIWVMLAEGGTAKSIMILYAVVELVVALIRIPYMKYRAGLSMLSYCKEVILPVMIQVALVAGVCWLCTAYITHPFRFVVTITSAVIIGLASGWIFVLNGSERCYTRNIIKKMIGI